MMPLVSSHIVKEEVSAGICFVAPDNHWEEKAIIDHYVLQCDVPHSNSRLSCALTFTIKRVKHTSRPVSVWLFHLLRTNINSPPMWCLHSNIFVPNVLNDSITLISRVGLYVYPLPRPVHLHILECHISNTVRTKVRRNTTYCDSNSKSHRYILYQEVFCAISIQISPYSRLGNYHVIPVLDCKIINVEVGTMGINSISVEREHGYDTNQTERLQKVKLSSCVDSDVHVVYFPIEHLIKLKMVLG